MSGGQPVAGTFHTIRDPYARLRCRIAPSAPGTVYAVDFAPHPPHARISLSGTVEVGDILGALDVLAEAPGWTPGTNVLWDARAIRAVSLSSQDIWAVAERTRAQRAAMGSGRSAFVVEDPKGTAMATLIEARAEAAEGREVRVFGDLELALAWLGVTDPAGP